MTTGRGMRGCGHLHHGSLDASHPTFHPTIVSESVPPSPNPSRSPCQMTPMSCINGTASDSFVLAPGRLTGAVGPRLVFECEAPL